MRVLLISLLLCACSTVHKRGPAQYDGPVLSDTQLENYAQAVARILSPRVFSLNRPAIMFYYEEMPVVGAIKSLAEAEQRLRTKPGRFPDHPTGMPVGLSSEADPKGARSFGKKRPRLFVIEIPAGVRFFNDLRPTDEERARLISALGLSADTDEKYSAFHYIGHVNAEYSSKFKLENRVIELLGTGNRLHHFNEARLKGCRHDDTDIAIQLLEPKFTVLAYYSDAEAIESEPISAYVKRLYDDTSFLNDGEAASLPQTISAGAGVGYRRWRDQFILTCGAPWAFE